MDRFGRRPALMMATVPLVLGWIVIALASSHPLLLAGRVLAGISVGLMAAPAQVCLYFERLFNNTNLKHHFKLYIMLNMIIKLSNTINTAQMP